ncbi:MAG: flagellar basal-body MS-ring/collar protein FliF [Sphingomonas sp.]|jgi:flagellar M-ring protein FliF
MSNSLTTQPVLPERFANPLRQLASLFALPIVRRSLPMIALVGLVAGTALAWSLLASPPQRTLFSSLPDADKAAVTQALQAANISSSIDNATGALTVGEDDYSRARILLAGQGLPKAAPGGYALLDQLPLGVSRAVEGERLRQARESELAKSIEEIDAVGEARVHLAMPESTVFVRDNAAPSASVILKLQPGRSLSDAQVSSIVNLVASSVPGMKPDAVTIVDQMGALLTHAQGEDSVAAASSARIDFQRRIEDKYRAQLTQLLTPLVGAGNFTAEVQADVNLDETQATRETVDPQGVLRAEQGSWTAGDDASSSPPGGIPGALSNTPPPASTLSVPPKPAPTPTPPPGSGVTTPGLPVAAAAPATTEVAKRNENYARAYDLGKEISVTRGVPGNIRRLSVAVLLRDPPKGKKRTPAEIQQITQLVQAAVGYDTARNDQVTVIARQFAGPPAIETVPAWYEASWLPIVARNATALVIAAMVLLMGVRPLVKAILKKREEEEPQPVRAPVGAIAHGGAPGEPYAQGSHPPEPVSIEMLDNARGYDERIGMVRGFTRDNPTRAALAVRDMIKADAS